jgi:hypothetical protein
MENVKSTIQSVDRTMDIADERDGFHSSIFSTSA